GTCTYTPDSGPNYIGPDAFTWRANDGTANSNVATFSIEVTANQPPVANDQSESTREAKALAISLDASDPDFDDLMFTIIQPPAHGTLDDCSSGSCTYTPDSGPNYIGPDSFTWRANDGLADSNVATFSVDVTPNQPPEAHDASRLLRSVEPTIITLPAEDADDDLLAYTVLDPPDHGTLDDCSFGTCTYTPGGTFTSSDSFTWRANDGLADSNIATLTIRLVAGPAELAAAMAADPPVVSGASYVAFPPDGTPNDVYPSALSAFPTHGSSFAILTSGDASLAATPNSDGGSGADDGGPNVRGDTDFDVTILKVDLAVPSDVNCLRLDLAFYSEEFPEFVGSQYNDAFIAELDTSTWTTSGSEITAPDNFAFDPDGNVISINSTGVAAMSAENAAGTTYDGATALLQAGTPITAGPHSVYLSIFDQGDHSLDSAVFVDNLRLLTLPMPETQCAEGVTPSNTPPSVEAGGPYTGDEGSQVNLDGTVTDPDPGDTVTTTWSYVPGLDVDPDASCTFGDATMVDTTVSCNDDGSYTLTLTASDGVNPPVTDTATLALTNVDPEISINSPSEGASFGVGAPVSLNATVADVGGNDSLTCSIDWGDGTVEPGVVEGGFCTGSHPYAVAGPYTIIVTVDDDDLGTGTDSVGITITAEPNTPPSVEAGGPYTGDEGSQ
ncbi:MAG TPA: Ig-like domain-containing protein, partial [Desertimonas sp.]|nr:Ig-like domain-containing protein [Desertimonas sp.]